MENTALKTAIWKLAVAGESAGLSIEQMIQLLNDGLTVKTLLDLISWRLELLRPTTPPPFARWVV